MQVGTLGGEIIDDRESVIGRDQYVVDTMMILSHEVLVLTEVSVTGRTDGSYFMRNVWIDIDTLGENSCRLIFYSTLTGDVVWLELGKKGGKLYVTEELAYSHRDYHGLCLSEDEGMDYVWALGVHRKKVNIAIDDRVVHWEHFSGFYEDTTGIESYYCPTQYSIGQGLKFMKKKQKFSNQDFYDLEDNWN